MLYFNQASAIAARAWRSPSTRRRGSEFDPRAEQHEELAQPFRVRGPCGGGDEIGVGDGGVDRDVGVFAARQFHFGRARGVRGNALAANHVGGGQQLRGRGRSRRSACRFGEMPHDLEHFGLSRRYSGARPPAIAERSYWRGSASSNVALSVN